MGMDGLSMSNTGMLREATSRDLANRTEESIHRDDGLKQVDQLQTQMRVKEDGHNRQEQELKKKDDDASYFEETKEEEQEQTSTIEFSQEDLENNSFYVKISLDGDTFELYDKKTNRLVEKISAEEINDLISKLNMASGILVNRSV